MTSPPYNVGMNYAGVSNELSLDEYRARAARWTEEVARVLKPGGRAWVNVPQSLPELARPRCDRWSPAMLWHELLLAAGLLFRDWVAWRQIGADAPTAWGSHLSPNAPNIRGRYELVLLFFKESWSRGRTEKNDIARSVWGAWTQNVWDIPCMTNRNGHPAPFPAELPRRAILLSTWPGDVVLDPFCGSGTTVRVAKDLGRLGIGCELSEHYCREARRRCAQEVLSLMG
jgi:site-specific DNA-methyltransferase (adenine-specific)